MLRIGIVTGEPSGDELGATLVASIKKKYPDVVIEGIGGEKLIAEGCHSLFDMERLSVMGLFEILGRYFELLSMQNNLKKYFINNPPDIFIGIDSPEFTLSIEKFLKKNSIKTVHYVSPSVWAWRESRLKTIKKSVDLMLTLFPFEERYYLSHDIPVKFVGHPLAHQIPIKNDQSVAREFLQLDNDQQVVALLPGSRHGEISRLTEPFIKACELCKKSSPELKFIAGLRDQAAADLFLSIKQTLSSNIDVDIFVGKTREVMVAADCVMLASGTATLETMLSKRPMVVGYKVNPLTFWIIINMLKIPNVSLPNLIAGKKIVPEFLQNECTPENLSGEVLHFLNNVNETQSLMAEFEQLHNRLLDSNPDAAADAVVALLESK